MSCSHWCKREECSCSVTKRELAQTLHNTYVLSLSLSPSIEPIIVEVTFRNPLKVPLVLSDLSLLWKFSAKDFSKAQDVLAGEATGEAITNEKEVLAPTVRTGLMLPHQQIITLVISHVSSVCKSFGLFWSLCIIKDFGLLGQSSSIGNK